MTEHPPAGPLAIFREDLRRPGRSAAGRTGGLDARLLAEAAMGARLSDLFATPS